MASAVMIWAPANRNEEEGKENEKRNEKGNVKKKWKGVGVEGD